MPDVHLDDEITTPDEARSWGMGISAPMFRERIAAAGDGDITLRVNSPGGVVTEGLAMYAHLQDLRAAGRKITCIIEGVAASMASVVPMAASRVEIHESALMMLHHPRGGAYGTAATIRETAQALDEMTAASVAAYKQKTGLSEDAIRALMDAETWIGAEAAVKLGFADAVIRPAPRAAAPAQARWEASPRGALAQAVVMSLRAPRARVEPFAQPPAPPPPSTPKVAQVRAARGVSMPINTPRLRSALIALAALDTVAREGAASEDPSEQQFYRDLSAAVPTIASAGQSLLAQADPEAAKEPVVQLAELLETHEAVRQATGAEDVALAELHRVAPKTLLGIAMTAPTRGCWPRSYLPSAWLHQV